MSDDYWAQLDAFVEKHSKVHTPDWYTPSKDAKTQGKNVARGKHPMGLDLLGEDGKTCGNCDLRIHSGRYLKCGLSKQTSGPGTDVRAKWAACVKWAEP